VEAVLGQGVPVLTHKKVVYFKGKEWYVDKSRKRFVSVENPDVKESFSEAEKHISDWSMIR